MRIGISIGENPRRAGHTAALAACLAAAVTPGVASAAYLGALAFIEPAGTVGPTDEIPVWIRFTLDVTSDPLELNNDPNATPPFGVPSANYPTFFNDSTFTQGYSGTLSDLTSVYLNTSFTCSGTFTTSCSGPPYDWVFNTSGPDSINFIPDENTPTVTIQPGGFRDYLFGTFVPSAGPVAPGDYYFYNSALTLNFVGTGTAQVQRLDQDGNPIPVLDGNGDPVLDQNGDPVFETDTVIVQDARAEQTLASNPACGDPSCESAFVRTVVSPVPVPAAGWLLATGIAGIGGRRLLRRKPATA